MTPPANSSILVADDNLLFSSGLVPALRRLGLTAVVVDQAAQVLSRARVVQPAAILLNLAARSLDGPARVRELKADPQLGSIPVVGYCGHLETELIAAGREAGCDIIVANSAVSGNLDDVLRRTGITLPT
jgi:CheY-like chemotaxis protein